MLKMVALCFSCYYELTDKLYTISYHNSFLLQDVQNELARFPSSVEVALLKYHKSELQNALLCLSLFATSFNTRQAKKMLKDLLKEEDTQCPDVQSMLQVRGNTWTSSYLMRQI